MNTQRKINWPSNRAISSLFLTLENEHKHVSPQTSFLELKLYVEEKLCYFLNSL